MEAVGADLGVGPVPEIWLQGRYLADGDPRVAGLVRLTLDVRRGDDRFVAHQQVELGALPLTDELAAAEAP